MNETNIRVKGMSCDACVRTVSKGLGRLPGVRSVSVDLQAGTVRISHEGELGQPLLRETLDDLGYDFGGAA